MKEEALENLLTYINSGDFINSDHLVNKVFENLSEGIMITDEHKKIILVNPAFERMTGYSMKDVFGQRPVILQSGIHNREFYNAMWKSIEATGSWQGEIWNKRKTGDIYPELLNIISLKDIEGKTLHYCGIFTDLSKQKNVENELEKQSTTDSLTELSNRAYYLKKTKEILDNSSNEIKQHAILFINLDRFKQVNDTLGHAFGDLLLVEIAKRLKNLVNYNDLIGRYGGDEFVMTITNIRHPREAAQFAEDIIREIEKPILVDDKEIFPSASIGISIYPHDGNTTEVLLNRADKAMYYSKGIGNNCYSFYFDDLETDANRAILLDSELRKAIEQQQFSLFFQPKIHTQSNEIIGLEALVRWNNDKLGFVSPAEFIPYAEETGLIVPLSEIVVQQACQAIHELEANGYPNLPIAVNISSIHFQQSHFLESIQKILEKNNTSAQNIEIEVTERTVMNNDDDTVRKLVRLKDLGFTLSLDDFGTGYSSLSYLVKFPFDYLKIDRSFIQQIGTLTDKQAVVDAIIQMAHRLNMEVIAEGVESEQQLNQLRKMGCDCIQGFYYSKPIPMKELIEFLQLWEYEQQGEIIS